MFSWWKKDPNDKNLIITALREAQEEVGLTSPVIILEDMGENKNYKNCQNNKIRSSIIKETNNKIVVCLFYY